MKYIKDIKAILSEIGMAFSVHGYMKSTGFFVCHKGKKKQGKREKRKRKKKIGKERKTKEIWSKKRSLNDTENYSQNTSLTNSAYFNRHDQLRFLSSARSSLVI